MTVDRPTKKGRLEILKVHSRNIPLADDVDLDGVARGTVGMSGADLANLVNEAALLATRQDKDKVDMADFDAARDKVLMGAKREEVITDKVKRMTAYHEIGHALVAWLLPLANPVHKVTIIPRGRTLGVTQFLPTDEDTVSISHAEAPRPARHGPRRPGGRTLDLRRPDRRRRRRPQVGHPAGPGDGHPVGDERPSWARSSSATARSTRSSAAR